MWTEVPPTAGLPLPLRDLWVWPRRDFAVQAARWLGAEQVGLACSGTASFIVILHALHRLSGRHTVVLPAYTCPLMVLAVAHCGLRVKLCDLAPASFNLDSRALAALCDDDTLAIVPTHLAGRVAALDEVMRVARACGAYVVEDAAQAFGARRGGVSVGLAGDVGFFSFAVGKGLTLFEGGLWLTSQPSIQAALCDSARQLLRADWRMEGLRMLQLAGYAAAYRPRVLPYAYGAGLRRALRRGDIDEAVGDVFAPPLPVHTVAGWRQAVGVRSLARLPALLQATQAQATARVAALRALPGVAVLGDAPDSEGVWPSLQVILPSEGVRDAALAQLWPAGLGVTRLFARALSDYAYLRPFLGATDPLPNARDFAARTLSISNSLWLDDARFAQILAVLKHTLNAPPPGGRATQG